MTIEMQILVAMAAEHDRLALLATNPAARSAHRTASGDYQRQMARALREIETQGAKHE